MDSYRSAEGAPRIVLALSGLVDLRGRPRPTGGVLAAGPLKLSQLVPP